MASFPAGPYILEIPTITAGFAHPITINCDTIGDATPGSSPLDITLRNKGGGGVILSGAANAFWDLCRVLFSPSTLASTYTLWKVGVTNTEREFISAGNLTSPNGGTFGTYQPAQQQTFTWRAGSGGILKLVLLEGNTSGNTRIPIVAAPDAAVLALNTYVLSDDSFLMARSRAFAVAAMNMSMGQNEAIFKARFRS